jgi:hypothetical protein
VRRVESDVLRLAEEVLQLAGREPRQVVEHRVRMTRAAR